MKRRACLERLINRSKEDIEKEEELVKNALDIGEKIEKLEKVENNFKSLINGDNKMQTFVRRLSILFIRKISLKVVITMSHLCMLEVKE